MSGALWRASRVRRHSSPSASTTEEDIPRGACDAHHLPPSRDTRDAPAAGSGVLASRPADGWFPFLSTTAFRNLPRGVAAPDPAAGAIPRAPPATRPRSRPNARSRRPSPNPLRSPQARVASRPTAASASAGDVDHHARGVRRDRAPRVDRPRVRGVEVLRPRRRPLQMLRRDALRPPRPGRAPRRRWQVVRQPSRGTPMERPLRAGRRRRVQRRRLRRRRSLPADPKPQVLPV